MQTPPLKDGRLLEISPFGTGFIEDVRTGALYGFHISMLRDLPRPKDTTKLDGQGVKFALAPSGLITSVIPNFSSHL